MDRLPLDVWRVVESQMTVSTRLAFRQTCKAAASFGREDIFRVIELDPTDVKISYRPGPSMFDSPTDSIFDRQLIKLRHVVDNGYERLVQKVVLNSSSDSYNHNGYNPDKRLSECLQLIGFLTRVHTLHIVSPSQETETSAFVFRLLYEAVVVASHSLKHIHSGPDESGVYPGSALVMKRVPDLLRDPCDQARKTLITSKLSKVEQVILHCTVHQKLTESEQDLMVWSTCDGWRSIMSCAKDSLKTLGLSLPIEWPDRFSSFFGDHMFPQLRGCDFAGAMFIDVGYVASILANQACNLKELHFREMQFAGSLVEFFEQLSKLDLLKFGIFSCESRGLDTRRNATLEHACADAVAVDKFIRSQTHMVHFSFMGVQMLWRNARNDEQRLAVQQRALQTLSTTALPNLQSLIFIASKVNTRSIGVGWESIAMKHFCVTLNKLCESPKLKYCRIALPADAYAEWFPYSLELGLITDQTHDVLWADRQYWQKRVPPGHLTVFEQELVEDHQDEDFSDEEV